MTDGKWVDVSRLLEQPGRGRVRFWMLISSLLIMFAEGFDTQALTFAAPSLLKEWHISKELFGPVLSASFVGYLIGAMIVSVGSDYFGRKITITAATVVFGVFTLATAYQTSLSGLVACRLATGIGLGGLIPALISINAEYVPTARRGARISLLYFGYGCGAAVGGFVPFTHWQSLFEIGGVLGLVAAALAPVVMPESIRFLLARGAAPSRVAAELRRVRPDFSPGVNDRFFASDVPERKEGGLPVALLFAEGRGALTVLLWVAFVLSLLTHYFMVSWLPTALTEVGFSVYDARRATGIFMVGGLAGVLLSGVVIDRKGIGGLAFFFLLATLFTVAIGLSGLSGSFRIGAVLLAGVTLIGGHAGLNAISGVLYPTAARSTGVGWAMGVGRIGAITAPVIGGFMLSSHMSTSSLFLVASLPALGCAGVLVVLARVRARIGLEGLSAKSC